MFFLKTEIALKAPIKKVQVTNPVLLMCFILLIFGKKNPNGIGVQAVMLVLFS